MKSIPLAHAVPATGPPNLVQTAAAAYFPTSLTALTTVSQRPWSFKYLTAFLTTLLTPLKNLPTPFPTPLKTFPIPLPIFLKILSKTTSSNWSNWANWANWEKSNSSVSSTTWQAIVAIRGKLKVFSF